MALGQTSISRSFRRKGLPTGGVSAPTKPKPKSDATGVDYGVAKSPTHTIPQMPPTPQAPQLPTPNQPIPGPVMPTTGQVAPPSMPLVVQTPTGQPQPGTPLYDRGVNEGWIQPPAGQEPEFIYPRGVKTPNPRYRGAQPPPPGPVTAGGPQLTLEQMGLPGATQPSGLESTPTPMPMPGNEVLQPGVPMPMPIPDPVTQPPQMPPTEQERQKQFLVARQQRQQLRLEQERKRVMDMNQQRRRAGVPQVHPGRRPRVSRRQMKQEGKNKLAGWVQKIMQESGIDREQAMWKLYNSSPNAQQVFKALRIRPRRPAGYRPMGSMR